MVAATIVLMLIAGNAVVESDHACEAATGEKLQGAVNGCETDAIIFFLHETVKFVGGEMFTRLKKCPQDGVALFGLFEADAFEVLDENRLGLAHTLARDGGLIVDSFLQHTGGRHLSRRGARS